MCDKGKKRHMGKARLICYKGGEERGEREEGELSSVRVFERSSIRAFEPPLTSHLSPPSSIPELRSPGKRTSGCIALMQPLEVLDLN